MPLFNPSKPVRLLNTAKKLSYRSESSPSVTICPIKDDFLVASVPSAKSHCSGIPLSGFLPLSVKWSPGLLCETHRWSCPLTGAEIYFGTLRLLMVAGSVSGAEMCYSAAGLLAGASNVLAGAVRECAIIPASVRALDGAARSRISHLSSSGKKKRKRDCSMCHSHFECLKK